jgi:4-diphosphocytidyl-2-C-methyl-D-erythritol kinase
MEETAYAKINLALHVRARESDGYHSIETIFAFCEAGDLLTLTPGGEAVTLTIGGAFAEAIAGEDDNLVLTAADTMRRGLEDNRSRGACLHLDKRLPVAAGLGGGSADAAAAMRLLGRYWNCGGDSSELGIRGASLGADVPACIVSRTRIGSGRGDELAIPFTDDVAGMSVLLVNPGIALSTAAVFRAWDGVDRGALSVAAPLEIALAGRNDLEAPAMKLCPQVAEVLAALRATAPLLARMSGSGATCFALYATDDERDSAAVRIASSHPGWWTLATRLR